MPNRRVEYVLRIGPSDRYRHLHIEERGKIVFFRVQYETKGIPSVMGGKKVQGYPVLRSRLRVQSEGKVPGGIG